MPVIPVYTGIQATTAPSIFTLLPTTHNNCRTSSLSSSMDSGLRRNDEELSLSFDFFTLLPVLFPLSFL